jgi:hypothetical protein
MAKIVTKIARQKGYIYAVDRAGNVREYEAAQTRRDRGRRHLPESVDGVRKAQKTAVKKKPAKTTVKRTTPRPKSLAKR